MGSGTAEIEYCKLVARAKVVESAGVIVTEVMGAVPT